jgi:hypothetical protein
MQEQALATLAALPSQLTAKIGIALPEVYV